MLCAEPQSHKGDNEDEDTDTNGPLPLPDEKGPVLGGRIQRVVVQDHISSIDSVEIILSYVSYYVSCKAPYRISGLAVSSLPVGGLLDGEMIYVGNDLDTGERALRALSAVTGKIRWTVQQDVTAFGRSVGWHRSRTPGHSTVPAPRTTVLARAALLEDMYQAKLYVDFGTPGVLDRVTAAFDGPFDVLEEEIHDDGTITFVVDTRGHRDAFAEAMNDAPEVSEVEPLGDEALLVRKVAKGASVVIRENHGKLNGVDRVHGTKRVFEVLLFRRTDLRAMIADLRELGTVRLGSLVEVISNPGGLSERQHEAVRTALEIGYFEWPRDGDAEALADALGVSHATALEHLRKGERKLLEQALETATAGTTSRDRDYLLAADGQ